MTSGSNELAILVTTIGVIVAAISLIIIVDQLTKIRAALEKMAARTAKGDDLIIENLEAILRQASETKNRLYSIDERVSRFSRNEHEQFVGELGEFLKENSVPLDKADD